MTPTMIAYAEGGFTVTAPQDGNTFSKRELMEAVQGFPKFIHLKSQKLIMVINEEKDMLGLPVNELATEYYKEEFDPNFGMEVKRKKKDQTIYDKQYNVRGDVLIAQLSEIE